MIRCDDWVLLFWALILLVLPLEWILASAMAALVHELCHMMAIAAFRGKILQIRLGISGAVMEAEGISGVPEMICALAGPAGSFCMLVFLRSFPALALCGLVQGMFNLLPVYPMDGGRILKTFLEVVLPANAERVFRVVQAVFFSLLLGIGLFSAAVLSREWGLVFLCLTVIARTWLRKKP